MPIVLDYHVPEDQGSLAWARHNQLLVCTPKVLHLLVLEAAHHVFLSDFKIPKKDGSCGRRGYLNFEKVFSEGHSDSPPREVPSISIKLRYELKSGFRSAAWWPTPESSVDKLVVLSYSGKVTVLECFAADICSEGSWQKVHNPDLESISERISCTALVFKIVTYGMWSAIATGFGEDRFALFLATEGGIVHRLASHDQTSSFSAHLLPDDAVASMGSIGGGTVIICSSLGQVSMLTTAPRAEKLILDDGILQPGPLAQLMDGTFLLAKFNHIYHFSQQGDLIASLQLKNYYLPLCGIVQKDEDSVWVLGKDASCFELNTKSKSFLPVKNLPWLVPQHIEASIADSEDEVESDKVASEACQPRISTMSFNASLVHGVVHGYSRKNSWILITQHREHPLGPKAKLYLLQTQLNGSQSEAAFAVDQAFIDGHHPARARDLNFWKISTQSCPICRASVAASSVSESIAICQANAGHIFEICAYSGTPIYPLDDLYQCHRCGLHIRKMDPPNCPFCNGSLLNARL